jgi:hypothetical protein
VLDNAVEEDSEKTAVHQSRRPLVGNGEGDVPLGRLGVDAVERVLREARVVRTDIECVRQIDPLRVCTVGADARRAVRRHRRGQLVLPVGELREHRVDGRMRMLQGEQDPGESAQSTRGGDGLRERLFPEPGSVAVRHPGFPFYLVQDSNGIAYCMGIRITR